MQDNVNSLVLKLKYEDDIRRIRVDAPETATFEEVQRTIGSLYVDLPLDSVTIKYQDEDGDKLTITSTLEWQEAIRPFVSKDKLGALTLLLLPRAAATKPTSNEDKEKKEEEEEETDAEEAFEELGHLFLNALKNLGSIDGEIRIEVPRPQPFFVPPPFMRPPHFQSHPHPHPFTPPGFAGCPRRGPCGGYPRPAPCFRARCGAQPPQRQPLDETTRCTFATTGPRYAPHSQWFNCVTCNLVGGEGCCLACTKGCHEGHALIPRGPSPGFFCDCGAGAKGVQCHSKDNNQRTVDKEKEKEDVELPTTKEGLMQLKVGELKAVLDARGVSYADCVDKCHLVEKIHSSSPSTPAEPEQDEMTVEAEEVAMEEEKDDEEEEEEEEEKKEEEIKDEENKEEEKGQPNNEFLRKLQFLQSMGFTDQPSNISALVAHSGDLNGAVAELLQHYL